MKIQIKSLEIETDFGRRTVHLTTPIEVDPTASVMPPAFRSLSEMFWDLVRQIALQTPEFMKAMSKAKA